jgi:hypothetical protein
MSVRPPHRAEGFTRFASVCRKSLPAGDAAATSCLLQHEVSRHVAQRVEHRSASLRAEPPQAARLRQGTATPPAEVKPQALEQHRSSALIEDGLSRRRGVASQRSPRRNTSASTAALLCSASRAAKTSVTTPDRDRRRRSLSRSRCAASSTR